jgi:Zn-dependent protease with chaperone function
MIFGIIGSFVLGLLDTKIGTKKAMMISTCLMIIAGILGVIGSGTSLLIAMFFVALFMGAASTSAFPSLPSIGAVKTSVVSSDLLPHRLPDRLCISRCYRRIAVRHDRLQGLYQCVHSRRYLRRHRLGCMLIFNPNHIKDFDNKLRANAGKPLDDALVGRKIIITTCSASQISS